MKSTDAQRLDPDNRESERRFTLCVRQALIKEGARKIRRIIMAGDDYQRRERGLYHPIAVAEVLARVAGVSDLTVLQAAILHDTIEDTQTTPQELDEQFGQQVRSLVFPG
jgi:(p)ppGpp synthase/HD superfamily hydrolase